MLAHGQLGEGVRTSSTTDTRRRNETDRSSGGPPATLSDPSLATSAPYTQRSSVDLPAPLRPTNATHSPAPTAKSRLRNNHRDPTRIPSPEARTAVTRSQ